MKITKYLGLSTESSVLTNQDIIDELEDAFMAGKEMETTKEFLLFHTNFIIYMSDKDYQARKDAFEHVVNGVVKVFNKHVRKWKKKYTDYEAHAKYWQFLFVPLKLEDAVDTDGLKIQGLQPRDMYILSSVYAKRQFGTQEGRRIVTTVHNKRSRSSDLLEINWNALKGVNAVGEGQYQIPISDFEDKNISVKQTVKAELTCNKSVFISDDGIVSDHSVITSDNFHISGKNDVPIRGGIPVVRLDSENILNPHVTIRKEDYNQYKYVLTANGEGVVLNERVLSRNEKRGLPTGSNILLNGEIQVTFTIKD